MRRLVGGRKSGVSGESRFSSREGDLPTFTMSDVKSNLTKMGYYVPEDEEEAKKKVEKKKEEKEKNRNSGKKAPDFIFLYRGADPTCYRVCTKTGKAVSRA